MDNSPLARVSPKIRNIIWTLVIQPNTVINLNNRETATPPSLTAACKQIRGETLLMFFTGRTVQLRVPDPADSDWRRTTGSWEAVLQNMTTWLASMPTSAASQALTGPFEIHIEPNERMLLERTEQDVLDAYDTQETQLIKLRALLHQHGYNRSPVFYTMTCAGSRRGTLAEGLPSSYGLMGFSDFRYTEKIVPGLHQQTLA